MIGYDPSYLNETETLLEEFHKIQKYLFENPIYKIYQANVDYVTNVNEYYITDVTTRSGDMLGVGDVVLFRNVYYGVITEINEDTQMFTIAEGISFRGARGLQGEVGPVGPVGPAGANGADGTNGADGKNGLSIYLYDGEITSTTTTATTAQVEVPTGRTLQVYDILFSTYETTYGAMAEVTEIYDTGLRVDYIGQVASAGGGGGVSDVQVNGVSIVSNGVANIPLASYTQSGVVSTSDQIFVGSKKFYPTADAVTQGKGVTTYWHSAGKYTYFCPTSNNSALLGNLNYRWKGVYANEVSVDDGSGTVYCKKFIDSNYKTSTLPDHTGTLLSAPSTWSTGTSGTAKLPSAGLYEIKFTLYNHVNTFTLNWDGRSVTYGPMFIVDAEQGGILAPFVDATGIIEVNELESGPASANVSYRKIGIA